MSLNEFAKDYLERARERLTDARAALRRKSYPEVVRYSQEATELSLKAALRLIGVEYPKAHDVGDILILYKEKFDDWFSSEIPTIAQFSASMAAKRSPALYGLEAAGKPPGAIFRDPKEAKESLKDAKRIHTLCTRLLKIHG